MVSSDTAHRILDAAEELLAERGYRGTSIRAIAERAEVNLAAAGYHFGSKAQLLAEVARRVIDPITTAQRAGFDRLLTRDAEPSVAELVTAFAEPIFDETPTGSARRARVVMAMLTDPAEEMRTWTAPAQDSVRDRYLAAFAQALPTVSLDELRFRLRGAITAVAVDRLEIADLHGSTPSTEAAQRWSITFLVAAMSAPPSDA